MFVKETKRFMYYMYLFSHNVLDYVDTCKSITEVNIPGTKTTSILTIQSVDFELTER